MLRSPYWRHAPRLLTWILFDPDTLQRHSDESLQKTASWLGSGLVYVALLVFWGYAFTWIKPLPALVILLAGTGGMWYVAMRGEYAPRMNIGQAYRLIVGISALAGFITALIVMIRTENVPFWTFDSGFLISIGALVIVGGIGLGFAHAFNGHGILAPVTLLVPTAASVIGAAAEFSPGFTTVTVVSDSMGVFLATAESALVGIFVATVTYGIATDVSRMVVRHARARYESKPIKVPVEVPLQPSTPYQPRHPAQTYSLETPPILAVVVVLAAVSVIYAVYALLIRRD